MIDQTRKMVHLFLVALFLYGGGIRANAEYVLTASGSATNMESTTSVMRRNRDSGVFSSAGSAWQRLGSDGASSPLYYVASARYGWITCSTGSYTFPVVKDIQGEWRHEWNWTGDLAETANYNFSYNMRGRVSAAAYIATSASAGYGEFKTAAWVYIAGDTANSPSSSGTAGVGVGARVEPGGAALTGMNIGVSFSGLTTNLIFTATGDEREAREDHYDVITIQDTKDNPGSKCAVQASTHVSIEAAEFSGVVHYDTESYCNAGLDLGYPFHNTSPPMLIGG